MMNKYFSSALLSVLLLLGLSSCKKWIDEDLNTSPNQPDKVTMKLILPGAESGLAYAFGGDIARYSGLFSQHFAAVNYNLWPVIDRYGISETDVNNVWTNLLYAGCMKDINDLLHKAKEHNAPYYAGIAKVLMAYALGVSADMWNDIPYSAAFKGLDNRTPQYDSQQAIYAAIQQLLTEAVNDLSASVATGIPIPAADDVVYAGNKTQWKKFAYSLSARYWIHLSKINTSASSNALTALAGSFTSNTDDAEVKFYNVSGQTNPWYQLEQGPAKVVLGKFFVDLLDTLNDPRLAVYAKKNASSAYAGATAGEGVSNTGLYSRIGTFYANPDSKVPLVTYVETKFIEAEAALRTGDSSRAATAHNTAIKASLAKCGVTDTAYENINAAETAQTITLDKILTQKYIALFTQPESWTDWRRTGVPALAPAMNNYTSNQMPRRFPYPQSEKLYNASNVPSVSVTDKVWWDQ